MTLRDQTEVNHLLVTFMSDAFQAAEPNPIQFFLMVSFNMPVSYSVIINERVITPVLAFKKSFYLQLLVHSV